jgi:sulfate-transporting ATPase
MANPDADMDKLMNRMEQLQNALDASNGWELERQLEVCFETCEIFWFF